MKKIILIILLFTICESLFPQNKIRARNEILDFINKGYYYEAIKKMDIYISKNPRSKNMFFRRGWAKLQLNDVIEAQKDFIKAKNLGYDKEPDFLNRMTSKNYVVKEESTNYIDFNLLSPTNGYKPIYSLKDSLRGALRPERTCFDVYYYNLTVKILPKTKSIEGNNQIFFKTTTATKKIQIDLAEKLKIISINFKGKELKFNRKYDAIFIDFDEILPANTYQTITIKYEGIPRIAPAPPWDGGFVWKVANNKWLVGVACEHLGASSWWPCKDHLSEKPDSMTINVQVPNGYEAVSNGNLRSIYPVDKKYTNYEWFVSYPINNYGVTFYMGNFVNFNETYRNSNGSYKIDYYVSAKNYSIAKQYYNQTKKIVMAYEFLYGEYPFKNDGIAMVEAPFAGMEHQSSIAIGDYYDDYYVDHLLIHETAHEWWGNAVTMGDMADAWISESFATYSEALYMEERFGYEYYIDQCINFMLNIANIWPIVGTKDVNDNTFPSNDIYFKGAAMLNNLRCTINDDSLFFSLIKGFYNNYKFKITTTSDFIDFTNNTTGHDYSDFFNKFLYDTIPPILEYQYTLIDDTLLFTYKWVGVGKNFTMPFSITVNHNANFRLVGSTEDQAIKVRDVKSFYLPNENHYNLKLVSKNSFTYYWTSWKH